MLLSSVLFTDYRRRVLDLLLLYPDEQYHLREIARLTGTQPGTLARELAKLVEAGILLKVPVGNQMHYRTNRECPIFTELTSILHKTSGLAETLATALLPLADQVELAFVFGSMASGNARIDSDIDLMLIGELGFAEAVAALYPLQAQLGREINPKVYLHAEWQQLLAEQGAFIRDVLSKPRTLVIGTERQLEQSKEPG
ncbi:MAG: nucleotidyltransferase domain-containing protein [Pseudomonadaceae bacterium]|nr:nucleotidyltransferase domain-containing protein [Pseudomonadaceae bacterium]